MGLKGSKEVSRGKKAPLPQDKLKEKLEKKCYEKLERMMNEDRPNNKFGSVSEGSRFPPLPTSRKPSGISKVSEDNELMQNAKICTDSKELMSIYFDEYHNNPNPPEPRVRLMVTALSLKSVESKFKNYFVKKFGIGALGSIHTILQINGNIIEWTDSSIVSIWDASDFCQKSAMISIELDFAGDAQPSSEGIRRVCETIAKWNGEIDYNALHYNCQDFTEALMNDLGISLDEKSKKFVGELCNLDPQKPVFKWTFEDGEQVEITTHTELEEIIERKYDGRPSPGVDCRVLKAIDRMFWIRFYSLLEWEGEEIEEKKKELLGIYAPLGGHCFFLNPADTQTKIGANNKSKAEEILEKTGEHITDRLKKIDTEGILQD